MTKPLSAAHRVEYDQLRSFLSALFDVLMPLGTFPVEAHPIRFLDRAAQESPARALRGLREAVNDMVEATQHAGDMELARLEGRLAEVGAPSLQSMRERRSQKIFAILDRGAIRDDDEWRMINGAIADQEDRVLTGAAREMANQLLGQFKADK